MVCNNFIRNVIVQAASVGRLSRRVLFSDIIRRGFYERVGFVGSRNPWNWRCATGFRTMMVDSTTGNGNGNGNGNGGSVIDVTAHMDDDSKYNVGGWKSEDGKLSCGFSSFRGKRMSMEDFYDVKTSVMDGKPVCLFGVFDGHGGSRAAEYLKEHLFKNLLNHPEFITDTKLAISETYKQTDTDFLNVGRDTYRDDGSTASTAIMVGSHLYVANVGDSRTVISKSGKAIPLSEDHKPNRSDERKRIENSGGIVMWAGTWRVGGVLAMSRAFGNRMLKQYVVAEPEIQDIQIDQEVELLVVASDGLWDVISNEDVIALAESEEVTEVAARKLTETAFTRGSCDNITCIVVKFHHNKAGTVPVHPSSLQHADTLHPTSPEDTLHPASPEFPDCSDTPHPTSPQDEDTSYPASHPQSDTIHPTSPEHHS